MELTEFLTRKWKVLPLHGTQFSCLMSENEFKIEIKKVLKIRNLGTYTLILFFMNFL